MNHNRPHCSSRSGAEKTSSAKSTNHAGNAHSSLLSSWALTALALLATGGFASTPAWAQSPEIYDGTSPPWQASTLDLPAWLVPPTAEGLLHGAPTGTQTSASLIVDYMTGATPGFVIGGYSASGQPLSDNIVIIRNGLVNGPLYGGLSHQTNTTADATNGSTGIANVNASTNMEWSNQQAKASTQAVTVETNNEVTGDVYGGGAVIWGKAGNAKVTGTATSSSSSTLADANAYASAEATNVVVDSDDNNQATIGQGATVEGAVYGGNANLSLQAGTAEAGTASNTSTDSIASASANAYANASASDSAVHAHRNTVIVNQNAMVGEAVCGGMANLSLHASKATADGTATAPNAFIPITSTTPNAAVSVHDSVVSANNNSVTVHQDAKVGARVCGGMVSTVAHAGNATTTNGFTAHATIYIDGSDFSANGNTVSFNGELQGDGLYGGYIELDIERGTTVSVNPGDTRVIFNNNPVAEATGNIVTIDERAQFSATSSLYGGYLDLDYNAEFDDEGSLGYDVFTGNTLDYAATNTTQLQTLANFQSLNFTLTPALANSSTALITAQDAVLGANSDNTSSSASTPTQVAVIGIHSGGVPLNVGATFLLVSANNLTGNGVSTTVNQLTHTTQQGTQLLYDVQVTITPGANGTIIAEIVNCQTLGGGICPASNLSASTPIPTLPMPLLLALAAAAGLLGCRRLRQRA